MARIAVAPWTFSFDESQIVSGHPMPTLAEWLRMTAIASAPAPFAILRVITRRAEIEMGRSHALRNVAVVEDEAVYRDGTIDQCP